MSKGVFVYRPMYGFQPGPGGRTNLRGTEQNAPNLHPSEPRGPDTDKDAIIADLRAQLEALKAKGRERVKKHRAKVRPPT